MAEFSKSMCDNMVRDKYVKLLMEMLSSTGEEVMRTKNNEFCFPIVNANGDDDFCIITVKVPKGANKGTEPYDGYAEAENFKFAQAEKEKKAEKNAEKKAKKIEKDKAIRAKKAEQKAARQEKEGM